MIHLVETPSVRIFAMGSGQFFRVRVRFLGAHLKVGGGPVVISPPALKYYWPFGPPLPPIP